MKKITYFYLKTCPYCRQADRLLEEARAKRPELAQVEIEKIEETERPDIADQYEYYYVPCFYLGKEKLLEGVPTYAAVEKALERAL